MVFLQLLAFGKVSDNRVRRKSDKAKKLERERIRREKLTRLEEKRRLHDSGKFVGGLDGVCEMLEEWTPANKCANGNGHVDTHANGTVKLDGEILTATDSEATESTTETSEEEMFL